MARRFYTVVYKGIAYEHMSSVEICKELEKVGFNCPICNKNLNHQLLSLMSNLRLKVNENNYLNFDTDFMCKDCRYKSDSFKSKCRNHMQSQLDEWWSEDGLFTNQVKNGTYHLSNKDVHFKSVLNKEWNQYGTEELKTCIYYVKNISEELLDTYKIGISNSLHIRSCIGDGLDRYDYKVIREFSNRYIAAYIEYKVKLKYCDSLKEQVKSSDINDIINYVNSFEITDEVILELNTLGWKFDEKYLVL